MKEDLCNYHKWNRTMSINAITILMTFSTHSTMVTEQLPSSRAEEGGRRGGGAHHRLVRRPEEGSSLSGTEPRRGSSLSGTEPRRRGSSPLEGEASGGRGARRLGPSRGGRCGGCGEEETGAEDVDEVTRRVARRPAQRRPARTRGGWLEGRQRGRRGDWAA